MSIDAKKIYFLKNKKIGVLGLGIENYFLVKYILDNQIKCQITICDSRNKKQLAEKYAELSGQANIFWKLGNDFNKNLKKFDILFRSPGWPMFCPGIKEALKGQAQLSSPMELFFQISPTKNIIGITGTKGKGTTSSLIYEILKMAKKKVWLGGNIGVAPFSFVDKIKKNDWVVLELSSFQLEDLTKSPRIAVITNFSKEHLQAADPNNPNFHKTMPDYWNAKYNIFGYQKKGDFAIINKKIESRIKSKELGIKSKIIYFEKSGLKSKLAGEHNKENVAAAVAVAENLRIPKKIYENAINNFKGLPHRIEFAGEKDGVKFYDDSFATIPDAAITALNSFLAPIILLAGGAEKNNDFKKLAKVINKKVNFLILFKGKATPRLKKEVVKVGFKIKKIKEVDSMKEGVILAKKEAKSGDTVLLSPGCASFGMFKNYKERGDQFKFQISKL